MVKLTKKLFLLIAEILRNWREARAKNEKVDDLNFLLDAFCKLFKKENPNFCEKKFREKVLTNKNEKQSESNLC